MPQIAGVFGDCIAGGYMPMISDRVYMTEQAYMVGARALEDVGFPRRELLARRSSLTPPGALLWTMLFSCVAAVAGVLAAMIPIIWPSGTAVVAALAIAGLHVLLPWPLIVLARSSYRRMFESGLGAQ